MMFGRIANFINGELWGRPVGADVPWAMVFPGDPTQLAAPSEPALRGAARRRAGDRRHAAGVLEDARALPPGLAGRLFTALIARARFIVEFFREPDSAARAVRPRHRPQHGPVAVDPAGPCRARAGRLGARARPGAGEPRASPPRRERLSPRRDASLADTFRRLIAATGPISVAQLHGRGQRALLRRARSARRGAAISSPRRRSARCSAS